MAIDFKNYDLTNPMGLLNLQPKQQFQVNPMQVQQAQNNFQMNPMELQVDPMQVQQAQMKQAQEQQAMMDRRQRAGSMMLALSDVLKGRDPSAGVMQRQKMLENAQIKRQEQEKEKRQMESTVGYLKSQGATDAQINLFKDNPALANAYITSTFKPSTDRKIIKGGDDYNYYADTGERVLPNVTKTETTSSVSNPLRTVTKGGKVEYNIRDLDLTDEKLQEINTGGSVVQPLGFTEKFESSKDVDFSPIKSKYLATQNIIIKTSELSQKFADEPLSALAVGGVSQYVDSLIQNLDAGADLLSSAKDKKSYQYVQNTSKSLSGKDFTDAIKQASQASGVAESRIRDLGYLFAAARGQEGRGLSDKDFENALKIVSGGVGATGRGAVLKDVSNSLREEFYRDINFDISTSENPAYVEKLQGLPELPFYIDPFAQQTTGTADPLGIR
jgi:hypothetical protein